jgi:hypothetical protein
MMSLQCISTVESGKSLSFKRAYKPSNCIGVASVTTLCNNFLHSSSASEFNRACQF